MVINWNVPRTVGKISLIKNLVIILVHIKNTLYWVGPEKYGFYSSQIICDQSFLQECAEIPEYGCFLPTLSSHVPIE
jgi:hypothetical protein